MTSCIEGRQFSGSSALLDYIKNDLTAKIDANAEDVGTQIAAAATARAALTAKVDGRDDDIATAAADQKKEADALTAAVEKKNTELKAWVTKELEKVAEASEAQAADVKYLKAKDVCRGKGLAFNVVKLACCAAGEGYNGKEKKCIAAYGLTKANPGVSCLDILKKDGYVKYSIN